MKYGMPPFQCHCKLIILVVRIASILSWSVALSVSIVYEFQYRFHTACVVTFHSVVTITLSFASCGPVELVVRDGLGLGFRDP